jgi:hypothetical protein
MQREKTGTDRWWYGDAGWGKRGEKWTEERRGNGRSTRRNPRTQGIVDAVRQRVCA